MARLNREQMLRDLIEATGSPPRPPHTTLAPRPPGSETRRNFLTPFFTPDSEGPDPPSHLSGSETHPMEVTRTNFLTPFFNAASIRLMLPCRPEQSD